MKYSDLYNIFLDANENPLPSRYKPIDTQGGEQPRQLSADTVQKVINSFSAYDLYNNPDDTPETGTTDAVAIRNPSGIGIPEMMALITRASKDNLNTFRPITEDIFGKGKRIGGVENLPQKIAAHEQGHFYDPSLTTKSLSTFRRNKGMLKYAGTQNSGEWPAWENEAKYQQLKKLAVAKAIKTLVEEKT